MEPRIESGEVLDRSPIKFRSRVKLEDVMFLSLYSSFSLTQKIFDWILLTRIG